MNTRLLLVTYHYIRPPRQTPYPGIYPMAPEAFAAQVNELADRYHIASPQEAERFLCGEGTLPGPSVLLTFDDGLREQYAAAREVLEPAGIRGLFFVTSQPLTERRALTVNKVHWLRAHTEPKRFRAEFETHLPVEWRAERAGAHVASEAMRQYVYDTPPDALLKYRINFVLPPEVVDAAVSAMVTARHIDRDAFCADLYMTEDQLRALDAAGHVMGAHGHSHAPFSRLAPAALDAEMGRNLDCLEGILGRRPTWVSYPYGREWAVPKDAAGFCRRHGFRLGVTLFVGWNGPRENPALIKRINTNEVEKVTLAA